MSHPFFLSFLVSLSWRFGKALPGGLNSSWKQLTGSSTSHGQRLIIMTMKSIINEMYTTLGALCLVGPAHLALFFWATFVQTVAISVSFGQVWRLILLPALLEHRAVTQRRPVISSKALPAAADAVFLTLCYIWYCRAVWKACRKLCAERLWAQNSLLGTVSCMCYGVHIVSSAALNKMFQF